MKLQTRVPLTKTASPVTYNSKVLLLGSCFVTNMGARLRYFKFKTLENPFGILYHPNAILNVISRAVKSEYFNPAGLFEHNEGWHSFEVHSEMSKPSAEALENALNEALRGTRTTLMECSHLLITLGTAWGYRLKESGALVANCHKVPQSAFNKELQTMASIKSCLKAIIREIRTLNEKTQIIFTISPVRHLKDGFVGNQKSKAHLISALHEVLEESEDKALAYFPAYEIQMDELRDYRFYDSDLLHPNELAADYIWDIFKECWIADAAYPVMDTVMEIQKGLQHRPFNPDSRAHQQFRQALVARMDALRNKFPGITFES